MAFITRFAPSLSGEIHIGNFRTMIYNYLLSLYNDGVFIIRIDDTNYEKTNYIYLQKLMYLISLLKLHNFRITFQSHYLNIMYEYKQKLLKLNIAYMCICTTKLNTCMCKHKKYDYGCCYINIDCVHNISTDFTYYDEIYGHITIPHTQLCDIAISRSNGQFLYNYASIVCDITMNITHIIRGEDHIQNTWKQLIIFKSIMKTKTYTDNVNNIMFAHLPLILDSNKVKLSKRNNDNNIINVLQSGICADALINYVTKLGWGYKNYENFCIDTLNKTIFNFSRFKKSNATFCMHKLNVTNKWHIKNSSIHTNIERTLTYCFINNICVPHNIHSINEHIINRAANIRDIYISILYTEDTYIVKYEDTLKQDEMCYLKQLYTCTNKQSIIDILSSHIKYRCIVRLALTGKKNNISESILMNIMRDITILNRIKDCYHYFCNNE